MSAGCSVCDGPSRPPERLGVEHHEGPVRAHADARTFTVCHEHTAGHRPARDAVQAAIASRLTFAQRRRHGSDCASCGSLLDLPMRATTRSLTVEPPDGPPYTVTLALPLIRCGGCGVDNVPAELEPIVHRCALSAAGLADAEGPADRRSALSPWPWPVGRWPFSRRRRPDAPRSPGPA